jgi:hypothetical protein
MLAELSFLTLTNVNFQNNSAVGVNSGTGPGGIGAGGGLAVFPADFHDGE